MTCDVILEEPVRGARAPLIDSFKVFVVHHGEINGRICDRSVLLKCHVHHIVRAKKRKRNHG